MTSTKNIPVLSKQPRAPYVLGSSLDSDDTGSTHWKPFKLEGIFFWWSWAYCKSPRLGDNTLAVSGDN